MRAGSQKQFKLKCATDLKFFQFRAPNYWIFKGNIMNICSKCNQPVSQVLSKAANDNIFPIYVLQDHELRRRNYIQNLAQRIASLPMSSREVPNWMADTIYQFNGSILWPNGKIFQINDTDIDNVFNNDGSFRWIRDFRRHANIPLVQTPQSRLIPRYRLIDLANRIFIRTRDEENK